MRRFKFVTRPLCMTAALLLALLPVFHGLHLASFQGKHPYCNVCSMGHVHCAHGAPGHAFGGSGCCGAELSGPRKTAGHGHDPSTCPFCRFFAQLMHGGCFNPPQLIQSPQAVYPWMPYAKSFILKICFFSRGCPRAPPV
jgi:hypothetical protein